MLKKLSPRFLSAIAVALALSACGGGGGDAASQPPPPNPLYVQVNGKDTNLGDQTHPLQTISKAAAIARNGYQINVAAGTYREGVTTASSGAAPQGLLFLANGTVVVDATGSSNNAGFKFSNSPGTVIDGFTILGGVDAGIVIKSSSDNFVIRNCIVHDNPGDGIRIQDSSHVTVFNNLVLNNGKASNPGVGIRIVGTISGSPNATVVNNTIFGHFDRAITIGTTSVASPAAFVHNNILQSNARGAAVDENIKVFTSPSPRSDLNYDGDFNVVFAPDRYLPVTGIKGNHDLNVDARFRIEGSDPQGFRLATNSPAIDAGDNLVNATALRDVLTSRTTTGGVLDNNSRLDIGFHFAP